MFSAAVVSNNIRIAVLDINTQQKQQQQQQQPTRGLCGSRG
jgi:hypothetical protein